MLNVIFKFYEILKTDSIPCHLSNWKMSVDLWGFALSAPAGLAAGRPENMSLRLWGGFLKIVFLILGEKSIIRHIFLQRRHIFSQRTVKKYAVKRTRVDRTFCNCTEHRRLQIVPLKEEKEGNAPKSWKKWERYNDPRQDPGGHLWYIIKISDWLPIL